MTHARIRFFYPGLCSLLLLFGILLSGAPSRAQENLQNFRAAENNQENQSQYKKVNRGLLMVREEDDITLQRINQKPVEEHMNDLANKYKEALAKGKYDVAHNALVEMAGFGHLGAMEALGINYYKGQGIERDYSRARFWLEKAARGGLPLSMHYLGSMYLTGQGLEPDFIKAYKWFSLAEAFYPEGPKRERAKNDKDNTVPRLSKEIKDAADKEVAEWITLFNDPEKEDMPLP